MKTRAVSFFITILLLLTMFPTQAFAIVTPPVFVSATTNVVGDKITVTFDKEMVDPLADAESFIVSYGASTQAAIIASLNITPTAIDLILETPIETTDDITLSYIPGTVVADDSGVLEAFTSQPVTNAVPIINSDVEGVWQIYNHTGNWGEEWYNIFTGEPITDVDPRGPEFSKHIVIKEHGARIAFYGYGSPAFKDFLFLPNDEQSTKIFSFDLDLAGLSYHSMEGGGFLFNSEIIDGMLSGYSILIQEGDEGYYDDNDNWITNNVVKLYQIDGIDADAFHESQYETMEYDFSEITLLQTYDLQPGNLHSIRVEASPGSVEMWDGDVKTINSYTLPVVYGNGIGLIASYVSHGCSDLSYFTYNNLIIRGMIVVWPIIDLSAELIADTANLTFTAPTGATTVIVEQSIDGIDYTTATLADPIDETSTTAAVTGLALNQSYYFRLIVTGGEFAGTSNVAFVEPEPVPISNLAARGGNALVNLTFSAPSGAESIILYQSIDGSDYVESVLTEDLTETSSSITVNGLTNGQLYYFKLVVQGGYFEGDSNVASATPWHRHSTPVVVPVLEEPLNSLRFNIGNIDSFLKLGTSDEVLKPMDVSPILIENRTLLPIRFVVEPLGGTILWNQMEQKVTITRGTTTIELWIGNNTAKVNGVEKMIDPDNPNVKPIIVQPGRTMLPLRFISEALGCTVDWDKPPKK